MPPPENFFTRIMGFGKFQYRICTWMFMAKIITSFHQIAILFLAPKISYTCEETGEKNGCPCSKPEYDRSLFHQTIQMEWDLICSKLWLSSFNQRMFQIGTLIGSLTFGIMSDRFGRKKPLMLSVVVLVLAGILAGLTHSYYIFTFLRFLLGLSVGGITVTEFVLIMEVVDTGRRDLVTVLYQVPFYFGIIILPVIGYFFRRYDHFQLAISIPSIVMLLFYWMTIESPRWLMANKKTELAIKNLEYIAEKNKRPTENIRHDIEELQEQMEKNNLKKGKLIDLFKTPYLRRHIIAMSYNWLSCSFCFYRVSHYVHQLTSYVFINVSISGCFALAGVLFSVPILNVLGRKTILIIGNIVCTVCLIILAFAPVNSLWTIFLACIGIICMSVLDVVVYLYCSELFPTVVRNSAIGFSSMMYRVGSLTAPFVINLKLGHNWLPPLCFAIMPFLGILISMMLTETKGCELLTTLEEGEEFGRRNRDNSRNITTEQNSQS